MLTLAGLVYSIVAAFAIYGFIDLVLDGAWDMFNKMQWLGKAKNIVANIMIFATIAVFVTMVTHLPQLLSTAK